MEGGRALVFQGGYHPHKIKHIIRVVFLDQVMYTCTSFWDFKKCPKLGKKGFVLFVCLFVCLFFGNGHRFWVENG